MNNLPIQKILKRFNISAVRAYNGTPCWEWTGSLDTKGYGRYKHKGKAFKAHRIFFEHFIRLIPEGLCIDHLCRFPGCVNPYHLEPVTKKENTMRGDGVTARMARKTHCFRGHELSGDNLRTGKHGDRQCRICRNMAQRDWYAKNKERARSYRKPKLLGVAPFSQ